MRDTSEASGGTGFERAWAIGLALTLCTACDPYRTPTPPIGTACTTDRECGDLLCADELCSPRCASGLEPCASGWDCLDSGGSSSAPVCRCRRSGHTEYCDGSDNDCDWHIDETPASDGCGTNAMCVDGECRHADGAACSSESQCISRTCVAGVCGGVQDASLPTDAAFAGADAFGALDAAATLDAAGATDGGGAPDAARSDAGRPDAARPDVGVDSGVVRGPGVDCAGVTCVSSEVCCLTGFTTRSCVPDDGTCTTFALRCDGPEDCPGEVCCAPSSVGTASSCTPAADCAHTMCHDGTDCAAGHICRVSLAFSACS